MPCLQTVGATLTRGRGRFVISVTQGSRFQSMWELLHSLGNALQCALPPWLGGPSQKVGSIAQSDQVVKLSFFKNWLPLNCEQIIHGNFKEQIERALQGEEKTIPNQIRVTCASC